MKTKITWPDGKRFAFTIFDDTDFETVDNVGHIYDFVADCGFRTTKSCWVVRGDRQKGFASGQTTEDPAYLKWVQGLQAKGFEIGWHSSTWHGLPRREVLAALDTFAQHFGHYPFTAANHSDHEGIYWGDARLSGMRAFLYNLLTGYHNHGKYRGHVEGDEYFWGDICRLRIKYFRNFVFQGVNTLKKCPIMPYHDPQRPLVNYWFASSNGAWAKDFNRCLSEPNQDRLEAEAGACIMYTHFVNGFSEGKAINPRFEQLMRRLSQKNGWFVPVATLLDFLLERQGHREITRAQRRYLEWKWLLEKLLTGTN